MPDTTYPEFLSALRSAGDFEEAASLTLRRLLHIAQEASREVSSSALPLRALLHLRPRAGYAGLYVMERRAEAVTRPREGQGLMPSASVWRWISEQRRPAAVDVTRREILPSGGPAVKATWRPQEAISNTTFRRLVDREATHIYALPILAGDLLGMVSLEVSCFDEQGPEPLWAACAEALDLSLALAAPWLASLPRDAAPAKADPLLPVVGPTMAPVVEVLRAFAAEDETLLLYGETGTGKSRLARWCHARSPRREGPFEVLDLLSVPEETQMGELFGWKKGAFTGAVADHAGFVTRAQGGSLFIDEIDKLSLKAQAGLLALLEERRYRVLGEGGSARTADVRFIAGTNADLRRAVEEGRFREDLFYRLDVLAMDLPPLRERPDEIAGWARFMLERRAREKGEGASYCLAEDAERLLERRPWPGNLRQLDNVLRRASTMASIGAPPGEVLIEARHLSQRPAPATAVGSPAQLLDAAIASVVRALRAHEGPEPLAGEVLTGGLLGLVLAHAVEQASGDRGEAFRVIGRPELINNRNHHRALKRECQRAVELFGHLGAEPAEAVAAVLSKY